MAAYAEGPTPPTPTSARAAARGRRRDRPAARSRVLPVRPRPRRGRRGVAAGQRDRLLAARPDRRRRCSSRPTCAEFAGRVSDSGEGRWTSIAAIEEGVPAPVLTTALYSPLRVPRPADFADKVLSAMRKQFGGHAEKPAAREPMTLTARVPLAPSGARPGRRSQRHHAEIGRPPPARPVRRRPRAAASGSPPRARACSSTTPSTGSPTRRSRCWSPWPRSAGLRERIEAMFARRADQRHRGPRRAARGAADAPRRARWSSTASTSSRRSTRCSTGWPPSRDRVRSGEWTRAHRQADPQRRQHRHRRLRPRAGDGLRGAARTTPTRDLDLPLRLQRRRHRLRRGDPRPRPRRDAVHRLLQDVHHARDDDQRPHGPRSGCSTRSGDESAVAKHFVAVSTNADGVVGVRHRHRQHVRLLGLGRRALLDGLGHRAVD